jgi:hypothetical protein
VNDLCFEGTKMHKERVRGMRKDPNKKKILLIKMQCNKN